jgi:hypothetical protein
MTLADKVVVVQGVMAMVDKTVHIHPLELEALEEHLVAALVVELVVNKLVVAVLLLVHLAGKPVKAAAT